MVCRTLVEWSCDTPERRQHMSEKIVQLNGKRQLRRRRRKRNRPLLEEIAGSFVCSLRLTRWKDGEKTQRESNPHWILLWTDCLQSRRSSAAFRKKYPTQGKKSGFSGCSRPQRRPGLQKVSLVICPAKQCQPRTRRFVRLQNQTMIFTPFLRA